MTTETAIAGRIRILDPVAEFQRGADILAPRVDDLNGKVLFLIDNLPEGHGQGQIGMNSLCVPLLEKLSQRFQFGEVTWKIKPKRGMQAPPEAMAEVAARAEVVINGSCT